MIASLDKSYKKTWVFFWGAISVVMCLNCAKDLERRQSLYPNGQVKEEWTVKLDINDNYIEQGKYVAWYENGQKKQDEFWEKGKLEGRFVTWHDNGMKHQEGQYHDGKMEGKYAEWDPDGLKILEGTMAKGKQQGKWTYFDEKGNITKQEDYVNGEAVK